MSNSGGKDQYYLEIESSKFQVDIYIDTYYKKLLAYEGYKQEVMSFISDMPTDSRIFDVGCGTGWFLSMLKRHEWTCLAGLDISPDMLRIAKDMVPEATFYAAPIQEYADSAGGEYDLITCLGTLHHMPDLERVARSLYALLKPGGVLLVHEPNEDWFYEKSKVLRGVMRLIYAPLRIKNSRRVQALREPWEKVPPSPYHEDVDISELLNILKQSGFEVEKLAFKNTIMRVFEGMLFRESAFDRRLCKTIRWLDQNFCDRFVGKRAGGALIRLRKPVLTT